MPRKKKAPEEPAPTTEAEEVKKPMSLNLRSLPKAKNCWTTRANQCGGQPWPTTSDVACWWCCHTFDGVPIPLPFRYEHHLDVFFVKGVFCSWPCAKTYNWSQNHMDSPSRSQYLFLLKKRTLGDLTPIKGAPHWSKLKMFGGTMTIEDFRNGGCTKAITSNVCPCSQETSVMELDPEQRERMEASSKLYGTPKSRTINFEDVSTSKNETLRLRRNKPLPGSNSNILEKILGIGPSKT
jgi:hypothetical protein